MPTISFILNFSDRSFEMLLKKIFFLIPHTVLRFSQKIMKENSYCRHFKDILCKIRVLSLRGTHQSYLYCFPALKSVLTSHFLPG